MLPEIRFNSGNACDATTWVCKVPGCNLQYLGETLDEATKRGMHIGLHTDSKSILVHFELPRSSQGSQRMLATVLSKGGAVNNPISMESLDHYHAELWGLIAVKAPQMPARFGAVEHEKLGGKSSEELAEMREMGDDLFARARKQAPTTSGQILWITATPAFITVYGKPHMSTARRIEWIKWKAGTLNMELTLPVFMAMFKQVTFYESSNVRMQKFKATAEVWQGKPLDWKGLEADERNLIWDINEGRDDRHCRTCQEVLNPESKSEYCKSCNPEKGTRDDLEEDEDEDVTTEDHDDLYVMQYVFGGVLDDTVVKIGRSACPENRRKAMEASQNFRIQLSSTFKGHGHFEKAVHAHLAALGLKAADGPGVEWFRMSFADAVREIGVVFCKTCDDQPLEKRRKIN